MPRRKTKKPRQRDSEVHIQAWFNVKDDEALRDAVEAWKFLQEREPGMTQAQILGLAIRTLAFVDYDRLPAVTVSTDAVTERFNSNVRRLEQITDLLEMVANGLSTGQFVIPPRTQQSASMREARGRQDRAIETVNRKLNRIEESIGQRYTRISIEDMNALDEDELNYDDDETTLSSAWDDES